MPQMAPLNWLMLFIYFIAVFFMFNVINYYNFTPKIKSSYKKTIVSNKMSWKW